MPRRTSNCCSLAWPDCIFFDTGAYRFQYKRPRLKIIVNKPLRLKTLSGHARLPSKPGEVGHDIGATEIYYC